MLEPGENGSYWVSARSATPPASSDEHPVSDEQATTDERPIADELLPTAEEVLEPAASSLPDGPRVALPSLPDDPRVALIEAGISIQDAGRVADILSESKNLFAAYNGLAKAFGRKIGGQYYKLIKERFEATPGPAPVQLEMTTEEQPMDEVAPQDEEQPQREATLEQFLIGYGLSTDRAATVSSVVNDSENLRIAYNELRKTFGALDGRAYLALVKEYKGVQQ